VKAQVMQPDGTYAFRQRAAGEQAFDAQAEFLAEAQRRRKTHAVAKDR
jgi:hypothetical protein